VADRDARDWQRLRDALNREQTKGATDRLVEGLRRARDELPASRRGVTPALWFDESSGQVTISIEGVPGVVVGASFSDAVEQLSAALVAERLRADSE
jgi:hypothetical protein